MQLFILLTVSVISLVSILTMVSYRLWEISTGKISIPEQKKPQISFLYVLLQQVFAFEKRSRQMIKSFINQVEEYDFSQHTLLWKKHFSAQSLKEKIQSVSPQKEPLPKAPASDFIQKISQHKKELKKKVEKKS